MNLQLDDFIFESELKSKVKKEDFLVETITSDLPEIEVIIPDIVPPSPLNLEEIVEKQLFENGVNKFPEKRDSKEKETIDH